MKKIILGSLAAALLLASGFLTYIYFALPMVWSIVYSDLRHFDVRGKMYYHTRIQPLRKEAARMEKEGKKNIAVNQILHEAHWLWHNTRNFERLAERIRAARDALKNPALIGAPDEQSSADGSWGQWYTEWFFKLDASYEQVKILDKEGKVPRYPLQFLDRINSPEKLKAHLNGLIVSYPERDGTDHARELNETLSVLIRMITRGQPANYAFHPDLKTALLDVIMNQVRDPETGYFVHRYQSGDKIEKQKSLSMTFHVISYLKGEVPDWPKIIDTTLAMKDKEFNIGGWLDNGAYTNHHNMDVVELFRLGWPHATPAQQETMRIEIRKMLDWCLKESLQADGSFKPAQYENDSVEEYNSFGVSFLARIGYFDPLKRFWTHEPFPEANEVRQRIARFIRGHFYAGGAGGAYYRGALEQLGEKAF